MTLPAGARRLFPHYDEADLDLGAYSSFLIGRLLEDGDGTDLAWLAGAVSETEIADWFARHGGRQLSSRSRELWRAVLGCEPGPAIPEAKALWPL